MQKIGKNANNAENNAPIIKTYTGLYIRTMILIAYISITKQFGK